MNTAILILQLGLIFYALYGLSTYFLRRSNHRSALFELARTPVHRLITNEEKSALQPFLLAQRLDAGDEVYELNGPFVWHSVSTQGNVKAHNTIGDVDVLLPYDAQDYLLEYNEAQVVLTSKIAVILRLNGFDLLEGRARARAEQAGAGRLQSQGEVADPPSSAADFGPDAHEARYARGEVDLLDHRQETQDEALERTAFPRGWLSATAAVVAFGLLWGATAAGNVAGACGMLAAGIAAFVLAVWLFVRRPAADASPSTERIDRLRGQLNRIAIVQVGNATAQYNEFFLGEQLKLVLPFRWSQAKSLPLGQVVELERRVSDGAVIGFGALWSVADEWRRFRPVSWGHHLLLLIVSGSALAVWATVADHPRSDAMLVARWLTAPSNPVYKDLQTLIARPPSPGSFVHIEGQGRCAIAPRGYTYPYTANTMPAIDCKTLRWGGDAFTLPDLQTSESVKALARPNFIKAVTDPVYDVMVVERFDKTVDSIAQACREAGGLSDGTCGALKAAVLRAVPVRATRNGKDALFDDWSDLVASVQPGQKSVSIELTRGQLKFIRAAALEAVNSTVVPEINRATANTAWAQGGATLIPTSPIKMGGEFAAEGKGDELPALQRWEAVQHYAAMQHAQPFVLSGLAVASEVDARGTPVFRIDSALTPLHICVAAAITLWGALAGALVLISGGLLTWRVNQSRRRNALLHADIATRPAPGSPGVF